VIKNAKKLNVLGEIPTLHCGAGGRKRLSLRAVPIKADKRKFFDIANKINDVSKGKWHIISWHATKTT
jgi:hypothetical protein